jgi:hypothetical protein
VSEMRGHVTQERTRRAQLLLGDSDIAVGPDVHWQCHSINSRLPLAFNAAAASNTLQVRVSLWVMGAWPLHQ